nr:hypothetical protein GCM10020092_090690 [Actinoplanes digitatis]
MLSQVSDPGTASLAAVVGIVVAFWSASGYTGAFMRASNSIYDVPEGWPIWKTLPIRLAVTAVIGLMLIASVFILVFTGKVAESTGRRIGLGDAAMDTWSIAKWPVLILIVSLMFAILYWASPNAKTGGFRWVSPGGIFAVVLWIAASGAFTIYLANFDSYDKTYGTVAGLIAFLVWLWISNIAILLGAELDAELERGRAIAAQPPRRRRAVPPASRRPEAQEGQREGPGRHLVVPPRPCGGRVPGSGARPSACSPALISCAGPPLPRTFESGDKSFPESTRRYGRARRKGPSVTGVTPHVSAV